MDQQIPQSTFQQNNLNENIQIETIQDTVNKVNKYVFSANIFHLSNTYHFEPCLKEMESNRILSTRFDNSGAFIASACEDGVIRVISMATKSIPFTLQDPEQSPSPVTCLRWRPANPQDNIKHTLIATYGNGNLLYWHATSNQILIRINHENNPLNCCDYSCEGLRFVTAGNDCQIRVYDAGRVKPIANYFQAGEGNPAHVNRIFALKYHLSDPFTLFSAGWDKQVIQWDIRTKRSQHYIFGPLVCGDGLDQFGNYLLTASYREDNQIQLWDLRTLKKVQTINWEEVSLSSLDQTMLSHFPQRAQVYSACFDKTGRYIYAGSVGTLFSEIRAYDSQNQYKCIDSFCPDSNRGILSIDATDKLNQILTYGVADGSQGVVDIIQYKKKKINQFIQVDLPFKKLQINEKKKKIFYILSILYIKLIIFYYLFSQSIFHSYLKIIIKLFKLQIIFHYHFYLNILFHINNLYFITLISSKLKKLVLILKCKNNLTWKRFYFINFLELICFKNLLS